MILVKNKLKKLKRDNEDDMLHYIKYSHLENIPETDFIIDIKEYKNKATQHPDIRNRSTQTHRMEDKATDTLDDLHKIDYKYRLEGNSTRFRNNDFMAQVNAIPVVAKNRRNNKSRDDGHSPSSGQSRDSSSSDSSGYFSKGLRLAEMTGNAMLSSLNLVSSGINLTMNVADFIAEATLPTQQEPSEEEVPEVATEEVPEATNQIPIRRERSRSRDGEDTDNDYNPASSSHQNPFRRGRSRSRDDSEYEPDDDLGERLLRRGASRSRSSTPKGYPKKRK